eukprot:gene24172-10247_t
MDFNHDLNRIARGFTGRDGVEYTIDPGFNTTGKIKMKVPGKFYASPNMYQKIQDELRRYSRQP